MAIVQQEQPGGIEWRWRRQKSRFWAYIWLHCLLLTLQQARCCQHGRRWTKAPVPQVVTLISLIVYCRYVGIRPPSATRDIQSQSPWFYSTIPTNRALALYAIRHEASRDLFATAELLVKDETKWPHFSGPPCIFVYCKKDYDTSVLLVFIIWFVLCF